jgi:hypothetical protein
LPEPVLREEEESQTENRGGMEDDIENRVDLAGLHLGLVFVLLLGMRYLLGVGDGCCAQVLSVFVSQWVILY